MTRAPSTSRGHGAGWGWWAAIAIAAITCAVYFAETRTYGLMGLDAYPVIIASRVQSLADLGGTFSEKLMDGRYPWDFYRPMLNATFALDYSVWGLAPVGYQLTNVLLFGGCGLAIFLLVHRLLGCTGKIAPLVALIFFLLHPLSVEVVPVPPRRPELLCLLLMTLALAVQIGPRCMEKRRWPALLPAVLSLLAMGAKETGFIMPALAFTVVAIYSPRSGWGQRVRHAGVNALPHLAALGIAIAGRLLVLGGMGGHTDSGITKGLTQFGGTAVRILSSIIAPQPPMQAWHLAGWLAGLALVGWALVELGQFKSPPTNEPDRAHRIARCRAMAFVAIWLASLTATTASAGRFDVWYAFMPLAVVAVGVGLACDAAVCGIGRQCVGLRTFGGMTLAGVGVLTVWLATYCPLLHHYTEYERATAASDEFFESLAAGIDRTPNAAYLGAPPFPHKVTVSPEVVGIRGAAILADHSLQAWLDLNFPDRRTRVIAENPQKHPPPAQDELVIVIMKVRSGFEGRVRRPLGGGDSG